LDAVMKLGPALAGMTALGEHERHFPDGQLKAIARRRQPAFSFPCQASCVVQIIETAADFGSLIGAGFAGCTAQRQQT